jgi:hypothetical protein
MLLLKELSNKESKQAATGGDDERRGSSSRGVVLGRPGKGFCSCC